METLYRFSPKLLPVSITLTPEQLVYESGISYMKKRQTISLKEVSGAQASAVAPSVVITTTDGREHHLNVMTGKNRDEFYAALQKALSSK